MLSLAILASQNNFVKQWSGVLVRKQRWKLLLENKNKSREQDLHSVAFCAACLELQVFHVKVNLRFQKQMLQFANSTHYLRPLIPLTVFFNLKQTKRATDCGGGVAQ